MTYENPRTDFRPPEQRTSATSIVLILIGAAILAAVGYDVYMRNAQSQQVAQTQAAAPAATSEQLQTQLQDAMRRVEQNEQRATENNQDKLVWETMAKAAVGAVGGRPVTVYTLQRSVFTSGDAQTRQFLRGYFKDPANLDKVSSFVVFTAGLVQPGPQIRALIKACEPLLTGPLPDTAPRNADALFCYEFLKRRQAEGGDVAAWQKLLATAAQAVQKSSG